MGKDDAARLTDTIAFIRTANVPLANVAERQTVADLLRDRDNAHRIPHTVSPAMSQGENRAVLGRDQVKENRHYRRAMILIRLALLGTHYTIAGNAVSQIPDANLADELGDDLHRVVTQLQDLNDKLTQLKNTPLAFLQATKIRVGGASASKLMDYGMYFDPGTGVYVLEPDASITAFVSVTEAVYHVRVHEYAGLQKHNKVTGRDDIDVPGSNGAGAVLMLTTQLTGCSVVYHLNGVLLVAAHVQPSGGTNAETMCTNLRARARFTTHQAVTGVFGAQNARGNDATNYVNAGFYNYCVGVNSGGWHLYAQQQPRGYGAHVNAALDAWVIA
jgi:hypothetical protein